jgi:succinate dehydrogenase / fumarate reductase flavoprotein subunit
MTTTTHETDVLIIGGGGGGIFAAINASDMGAKVMIVSKSLIGRGGCSSSFGYVGASPPEKTTTNSGSEKYFTTRMKNYGHFLADQEFVRKSRSYIPTFYERLEKMGLYFRRDGEGEIISSHGLAFGSMSPKYGNTGKSIMDILRGQLFMRNIPMLEETTGVTLITAGGRVTGAIVFDFIHGRLHEIHAKAVILACGHVNRLWERSTGTREQAGNGLAMAFHAGAELAGLEIVWWHIGDIAHPQAWMRSHMYPGPLPMTNEVVEYYNSKGELFFHSNMYRDAQPSYYLSCKRLIEQINAGLARADGGYYASFAKVDPFILKEYTTIGSYMRKLGLDPQKDMIECGMTSHQQRGGVVIDHEMTTRVDGLYIAGSLAADFTSGIYTVCWEGEVAARSATEYARRTALVKNETVKHQVEERFDRLLAAAPHDPVSPSFVKAQIRRLMSREMDYFKSEAKMKRAIEGLREIRRTLVPRMQVRSKTRAINYELVDAIDVPDMLDAAELMCIASLNRTESRGSFYRVDYPRVDNKNWLKNIVLSGDVSEPKIRLQDANLKYARPEDESADFLTTVY